MSSRCLKGRAKIPLTDYFLSVDARPELVEEFQTLHEGLSQILAQVMRVQGP